MNASTRYIVKAGDTLSAIALRYGVSVDEIAQVNSIQNKDRIFVNQKLVIPQDSFGGRDEELYTISKGDSIFGLARKMGFRNTANQNRFYQSVLRLNPKEDLFANNPELESLVKEGKIPLDKLLSLDHLVIGMKIQIPKRNPVSELLSHTHDTESTTSAKSPSLFGNPASYTTDILSAPAKSPESEICDATNDDGVAPLQGLDHDYDLAASEDKPDSQSSLNDVVTWLLSDEAQILEGTSLEAQRFNPGFWQQFENEFGRAHRHSFALLVDGGVPTKDLPDKSKLIDQMYSRLVATQAYQQDNPKTEEAKTERVLSAFQELAQGKDPYDKRMKNTVQGIQNLVDGKIPWGDCSHLTDIVAIALLRDGVGVKFMGGLGGVSPSARAEHAWGLIHSSGNQRAYVEATILVLVHENQPEFINYYQLTNLAPSEVSTNTILQNLHEITKGASLRPYIEYLPVAKQGWLALQLNPDDAALHTAMAEVEKRMMLASFEERPGVDVFWNDKHEQTTAQIIKHAEALVDRLTRALEKFAGLPDQKRNERWARTLIQAAIILSVGKKDPTALEQAITSVGRLGFSDILTETLGDRDIPLDEDEILKMDAMAISHLAQQEGLGIPHGVWKKLEQFCIQKLPSAEDILPDLQERLKETEPQNVALTP